MFNAEEILVIRSTNVKPDPALPSDVVDLLGKLQEVRSIDILLIVHWSESIDILAGRKIQLKI